MSGVDELPNELCVRRRGASQTFRFGASSVSVTTRDLVRRSICEKVDYLSLAKHPATAREGRSSWWLVAGGAFSVGASIQIIQGAYSVGDIVLSVVWCGGLFAWWWLGRCQWRGYLPLMVWDVGADTDEVLDVLQKRRVALSFERFAKHDPANAVAYVIDLASEELIDRDFATELLRPEPRDDYWPGIYL